MTDPVTNILAALDFNEDLAKEVDERIAQVAARIAQDVTEKIANQLVSVYLNTQGSDVVTNQVANIVATKINDFRESPDYVNRHSAQIRQLATQASQEHYRALLRQLTGSYNI